VPAAGVYQAHELRALSRLLRVLVRRRAADGADDGADGDHFIWLFVVGQRHGAIFSASD
jgi:hypothetical protein